MKILILSQHGDGLGIADRLAQEGNEVLMYIKEPGYELAGKGLVEKVESWRPHFRKVDLIICDMVGFGKHAELFKEAGKPVFSCSKFFDMIELDREKGIDLLKRAGITTPETHSYPTPKEAEFILTVWEDPGYVIKPSGNVSTALTSVHRDKETFKHALSQLPPDQPLIVQAIVEGVEISTEGWFNGRDWIEPFNHTFEEKRFMEGDIGPNTGCMGNVVFATSPAGGDKLVKDTLHKLTPVLKKDGYRGPIDINCIVNEKGAFALELSPRLGYDAIEALLEGCHDSVTDVFFETALGVKKKFNMTQYFTIAVRLSVPPWPHATPDSNSGGIPFLGVDEKNRKHVWLTDVYMDGGDLAYAAGDGVVCKVTAEGRSVREARNRAYRTIGNLTIPNVQYRRDIGSRVDDAVKQLKEWGYL